MAANRDEAWADRERHWRQRREAFIRAIDGKPDSSSGNGSGSAQPGAAGAKPDPSRRQP